MKRNKQLLSGTLLTGVSAALIGVAAPQAIHASGDGKYMTGDFHNHTTCSDGATSVRTLIDESTLTYDLDWFSQAGHGGGYIRDCRISDPEYDGPQSGDGDYWVNTIGEENLKGDESFSGFTAPDGEERQVMWRWQNIQEYNYPEIYKASQEIGKPVYQGLEWIVPGHEHASTAVVAGQYTESGEQGNADAMAQFEYLFDRADNDLSEGGGQGWTGKIPNVVDDEPVVGDEGHAKTVAGVEWMRDNHPDSSYVVPAHLERAGAFDPNDNRGWNIEHLRDMNNAAPDVAFGFESQPGHQAQPNRGGYNTLRAFGGTYGGTGYYAAKVGGMWDALLGEGRKWWFFASSDWHNRGEFGPFEKASTNDFWPGEYQKDYVYIVENNPNDPAQDIVDGLRSGNSYVVMGDLIDRLRFKACANSECADMGETLAVHPGDTVTIRIQVRDPDGANHSPYTFNNPSLAQLDIHQPINKPQLDHVDLIAGDVTGIIEPDDAAYRTPVHPSTHIMATFNDTNWISDGRVKHITYEITAERSMYFRLRGTNMPYGTPGETDKDGNPLADYITTQTVSYVDPDTNEEKALDMDVEAWTDLWFYSNPIFIEVPEEEDSV